MADVEARKILTGLWADSGDRTDPDDATLDPPLDRETGWPASFSASDGNTPRREPMNQIFRELDGAASDGMRWGLRQYDDEIPYHQHARAAVDDREFRAAAANGPGTTAGVVDPLTAGQVAWVEVAGAVGVPSAPAAPQATAPRSRTLDWFWSCPLDRGAQVTSFMFEWRVQGTSAWTAETAVTTPRFELTSLVNGTTYEARVMAVNSVGGGSWSPVGQATAAGDVPGGGATLALRADAGDTEADLGWLEPDDGGVSITGYEVQWRTGGQAYSSGRQSSVTVTSATVTGLVNGTEYFFQVRAINGQGNGAWSNEASATPSEAAPDEAVPDRASAPTGSAGQGEATWVWPAPSDNGSDITSYAFRFRTTGAGAWTSRTVGVVPTRTETGLTNGVGYEAQVRATNGVGQQGTWSPSGTVTPSAAVPDQVQTVALSNVVSGIRAAWGVPDDNGDALDGYRAQIANNSSFTAASTSVVTGTSHTFTAVTDGTTYWVRVRAYNDVGNGDWSPGVSLARDDGVAVPNAPDEPEATPRRPLIVDWAWAPGDDNGEAADEYQLQWRLAGSAWSGNVIDSDEPCARHSVDDATTAVEARARSHNGDGWGLWSPTGSIAAADLIDAVPRVIEITTTPIAWIYGPVAVFVGNTTGRLRRNGFNAAGQVALAGNGRYWALSDLTSADMIDVFAIDPPSSFMRGFPQPETA